MQPLLGSKTYGAVTIGTRGQLVIPAGLRKTLKIKSGDQLMVFGKLEKKTIILMPESDFSKFLDKASRLISHSENKLLQKTR